MEGSDLLGDERENVGLSRELLGLGVRELGGEAMENGVVSVDDGSGSGGGERIEGGLVPVAVDGEDGGFGTVVDADNEGAPL